MRELKELALMVDPIELKMTTNNLLIFNSDSKLASLFNGIILGNYNSDEDALQDLYPDYKQTSGYRKLKFTLKQKLKNAMLLFNEHKKEYSDYQKAYYQCNKELAVVKILLGRHARAAAIDIAQSVLKKAIKFEFTDIVVDMAKVLRLHFGARVGDEEKFTYYNAILKENQELLSREDQIQEAYIDLVIYYVNNRSPKADQHRQAQKICDSFSSDIQSFSSYQFQLYYYLVELMVHTTIYEYESALKVCDRAIQCFSSKPYNADIPLQIFYYQQLVCYIQLGKFHEGQVVIQKSLSLISEGSFNWFKYHELYILLAIHGQRFEEAAQIFKTAFEHRRFGFLPDNSQEIWRIHQSYLFFLWKCGKIKDKSIFKNYKLSRFLNEVLIYSKDKSGMNASIIIVQILLLIANKQYEEAVQKFESTQQYCYRYLKKEHTQRSYLFMKILLKLIQTGFNKSEAERKTKRLFIQLGEVPLEVANQAMEIEFIPYELLWDLVMDIIE